MKAKNFDDLLIQFMTELEHRMINTYENTGEHWAYCQNYNNEHDLELKAQPRSTRNCAALIPLYQEIRRQLGLDNVCPACGQKRPKKKPTIAAVPNEPEEVLANGQDEPEAG